MGMEMAQVERLNGKAFTLTGFEWDMSGYTTDWRGTGWMLRAKVRLRRTLRGCVLPEPKWLSIPLAMDLKQQNDRL